MLSTFGVGYINMYNEIRYNLLGIKEEKWLSHRLVLTEIVTKSRFQLKASVCMSY